MDPRLLITYLPRWWIRHSIVFMYVRMAYVLTHVLGGIDQWIGNGCWAEVMPFVILPWHAYIWMYLGTLVGNWLVRRYI